MFKKVPTLGITTNSFETPLQTGEITIFELIDWAASLGFGWIELRAGTVAYDTKTLKAIKKLADTLSINIHYGWNNEDIINGDAFLQTAIENAKLFGRNVCCRIVLAPTHVEGKRGYSKEDFIKVQQHVANYNKLGEENGLKFCFENSFEPICGDNHTYFGMEEIFASCPHTYSTLDCANLTRKETLGHVKEADLVGYYLRNKENLIYFHMKMTKDKETVDCIVKDGDFKIEGVCKAFEANKEMLLCLELPQKKHLGEITQNVLTSLKVLEEVMVI